MMKKCFAWVSVVAVVTTVGCDGASSSSPGSRSVDVSEESMTAERTGEVEQDLSQPQQELPESAFVRSNENRDPFEPMVHTEPILPPPIDPLLPLLAELSLDEVRLIAIISGEMGSPQAMLVDTEGRGHTVSRGDLLCRAEQVYRGPHVEPLQLTWRVERIRPDRVVLSRPDHAHPNRPLTRVLRLHPEDELTRLSPASRTAG